MNFAKWSIVFLTVATFVAMSTPASAEELAGQISITPMAGLAIPGGDFAGTDPALPDEDNFENGFANMGFTVGGTIEYYVTNNWVVGGSAMYNRFTVDDEGLYGALGDTDELTVDGHWSALNLGLFGKYLFPMEGSAKFYVKAGLSFGGPDASVDVTGDAIAAIPANTSGTRTVQLEYEFSNAIGFDGGIGCMWLATPKLAIVGEAGFTHLATSGKDLTFSTDPDLYPDVDLESGMNTTFFGVRVGGAIFFGGEG